MHRNTIIRRASIATIIALSLIAACKGKSPSMDAMRADMIKYQLEQRGMTDKAILNAFNTVPREEYVLPEYRGHAYDDNEAPIGHEQSLDRPYENALMIKALALTKDSKVLEIGTGSGYLASLMSQVAKEVFTIDIDHAFATEAAERVKRLGYANVHTKEGDGFLGWPENAPFDAIVMTCSPSQIPQPLIDQLAEGGHIVLPLGGAAKFQELMLYEKKDGKLNGPLHLAPTEFVPMKGKTLENP